MKKEEKTIIELIKEASKLVDKEGNVEEGYWDIVEDILAELGITAELEDLKGELGKKIHKLENKLRHHDHKDGKVMVQL